MVFGNLFEELSPHARVASAVAPFLISIVVRLFFGGNRVTYWGMGLCTAWLAVNVFLAPYSPQMRQDILNFQSWLP